ADPVVEVTGRGGEHVDPIGHAGLVAHAKRAAGDFDASAHGAVDGEVGLVLELRLVHAGRRADPGADARVELGPSPDLAGGAEVTDVGHAGTQEHVLDRGAGHFGEDLDVVRIVRAGQDRLGDLGQ